MFERGYLHLGTVAGARVRAHWTLPIGALIFGGVHLLSPGYWLGFVALVLLHELGHAVLVRRRGYRVVSLDLHGMGGLCRWQGQPTRLDVAVIAWGGVAAQAGLLVPALVATTVWPPTTALGQQLAAAFVTANIGMILLNLIPVPPLDGADAWQLFRLRRQARRARARQDASRELARLDYQDCQPLPPEMEEAVVKLLDLLSGRNGKRPQ